MKYELSAKERVQILTKRVANLERKVRDATGRDRGNAYRELDAADNALEWAQRDLAKERA